MLSNLEKTCTSNFTIYDKSNFKSTALIMLQCTWDTNTRNLSILFSVFFSFLKLSKHVGTFGEKI